MVLYETIRSEIRSGDIIAFEDRGTLFGWLIRTATRGKYAHVALAWVVEGQVLLLESRLFGGVKCHRRLSTCVEFDWIKTFTDWTPEVAERALSRLGQPYSLMNALRQGFRRKPTEYGEDCSLYVADVLSLERARATPRGVTSPFIDTGAPCVTVVV